jgi:CRP-like cAMP-binding protein
MVRRQSALEACLEIASLSVRRSPDRSLGHMADPAATLLSELFPTLSEEGIAQLVASGRRMTVPNQVTLCNEGEIEDSFYVIVAGRVDVFKVLEGQRMLINYLTAGAHFGDIALLLDRPRSATIITSEPTDLFIIDRAIFGQFMRTNAEIVVALSQMVIRRLLVQEEKHLTEIARLKKRDVGPAKVFVSYARADQAFTTRLANNLLKNQIDVWLDLYRIDPGKSWARQIGEALDSCQILLLVLSPTSVASENVEDEWNYFLDQKKQTVSILYQPCKVPYRLSKLQHIDFTNADYDQAVARVVATLNTLL